MSQSGRALRLFDGTEEPLDPDGVERLRRGRPLRPRQGWRVRGAASARRTGGDGRARRRGTGRSARGFACGASNSRCAPARVAERRGGRPVPCAAAPEAPPGRQCRRNSRIPAAFPGSCEASNELAEGLFWTRLPFENLRAPPDPLALRVLFFPIFLFPPRAARFVPRSSGPRPSSRPRFSAHVHAARLRKSEGSRSRPNHFGRRARAARSWRRRGGAHLAFGSARVGALSHGRDGRDRRIPSAGVTLDLCADISRDLSAALDVAEAIAGPRVSARGRAPRASSARSTTLRDYAALCRHARQRSRFGSRSTASVFSAARLKGVDGEGQVILDVEGRKNIVSASRADRRRTALVRLAGGARRLATPPRRRRDVQRGRRAAQRDR